jgi:hypothetical protein
MTNQTVEFYQNIASLFTSTVVALNILGNFYYNTSLDVSIPVILSHFTLDFYFCKPDVKLHHYFGLSVILFKLFHNVATEDHYIVTLSFYKTEISTFFYVFKLLFDTYHVKNVPLKTVNNILFFATFFKYRIYDYYVNVISNPFIYDSLQKYVDDSLIQYLFLYTSIYGMFMLNLYWFMILCKIAYKPIESFFQKSTVILLSHRILTYSYFANIFISYYIYSLQENVSYIFDIIGIIALSFGNYYYHNEVAKYYEDNNEIEYTSYELIKPFFVDKLSIHMRSFLCIATSLYYTSSPLIYISLLVHISSITRLIVYMYELKMEDKRIVYDVKDENSMHFLTTTNMLISAPVLFDTFTNIYHSPDIFSRIHIFFITVALGLVLKINPFYEMNHVVFHMLLMLQTAYFCFCNLR